MAALDAVRAKYGAQVRPTCVDQGCRLGMPATRRWPAGKVDHVMLHGEKLRELLRDPGDRRPDVDKAVGGMVFVAYREPNATVVVLVELKAGTYDSDDVSAKFKNSSRDAAAVGQAVGLRLLVRHLLLAGRGDTQLDKKAVGRKRRSHRQKAQPRSWYAAHCGFNLADFAGLAP